MSEWQPIHTAPRDGTEIIIADSMGVTAASFSAPMDFDEWWETVGDEGETPDREGYEEYLAEEPSGWVSFGHEEVNYFEPSLWMPFPSSPLVGRKS